MSVRCRLVGRELKAKTKEALLFMTAQIKLTCNSQNPFTLSHFRRSVDSMVVGPNVVGFTPPPIAGRLHSLTTPPGVPSPSPPPPGPGLVAQPGKVDNYTIIRRGSYSH